jgi:hypothetical protein
MLYTSYRCISPDRSDYLGIEVFYMTCIANSDLFLRVDLLCYTLVIGLFNRVGLIT